MKLFFILFGVLFLSSYSYAQKIDFDTESIIVGACSMNVYKAITGGQKASGMLGFTDATFANDGMIFIGNTEKKHFFHTVGMKMDIRIMGINKIGLNRYIVQGAAKYSPIGIKSIEIIGESILEIPESLYKKKFENCLFK